MAKQAQIAFDFDDQPVQPEPAREEVAIPKKPDPTPVLVPEVLEVPVEHKPLMPPPVTMVEEEPIVLIEAPFKLKQKSTRGRKSIKEMSAGVDLIDVPSDDVLFEKMYYSIGKVAEMFKVNQSLIRLWENEFDVLKPKKNRKGDRLFRPEDIKNIQLIYHLTRERKYTMEGAKDFIRNNKRADEKFAMIESMKKLKGFLNELIANL